MIIFETSTTIGLGQDLSLLLNDYSRYYTLSLIDEYGNTTTLFEAEQLQDIYYYAETEHAETADLDLRDLLSDLLAWFRELPEYS